MVMLHNNVVTKADNGNEGEMGYGYQSSDR